MPLEELVIASHNRGKIEEITKMLSPFGVKIFSAEELKLPDVEETGMTFAENAGLKAEQLSAFCGKPCLADDSGLCVDALGGRPGVYSARYAPNRDFDLAMKKLINELEESGNPDWSAHFSCMLALKIPGQECHFFEGRVNGKIISERRGCLGFGFDPIFVPDGFEQTFAEMSGEEKSAISHRGRAFAKFIKEVFQAG